MFVSDLIDYLLPEHKRQLSTNAHPSVEITLMKQEKLNRTAIHLVNMSGHSGTTFFDAIEMKNISIRVKGEFKKATILDGEQFIPVKFFDGYTSFNVPVLKEFCTVFLYE